MHEEDAFWCLVFIIEHLMPVDYYSRDKQLIGAQVDQVNKCCNIKSLLENQNTKYGQLKNCYLLLITGGFKRIDKRKATKTIGSL